MLKRLTIDGVEYMPVKCPKVRTWQSSIYCSRDDGAALELKLFFETQPERDKAFLAISKLVGRDA